MDTIIFISSHLGSAVPQNIPDTVQQNVAGFPGVLCQMDGVLGYGKDKDKRASSAPGGGWSNSE